MLFVFAVALTGFAGKCYTHQFAKYSSKCEANHQQRLNQTTVACGFELFSSFKGSN